MNSAHFTSKRQDHGTPRDFFARLHRRFAFTVDACALPYNAKLSRFWSPADDSLSFPWVGERAFMNPEYGSIWDWTKHAAEQWSSLVVGLVPARTSTQWWHRHVMEQAQIVILVEGRLKFTGNDGEPAPFPSAVVVWEPGRPKTGDSPRFETMKARVAAANPLDALLLEV